MSELSWTYIAGLFDGEGTVNIQRPTPASHRTAYRLAVRVQMTHEPTIRALHEAVGYGSVLARPPSRTSCLPFWRWTANSQGALAFLNAVRPHLITKARAADVGIAFQSAARRACRYAPVTAEEMAFREDCYLRLAGVNNPAASV